MPARTVSPRIVVPAYEYRKPVRGSLVWWVRLGGIIAFIAILLWQLPRSQSVALSRIDLRWLGFCMLLTPCQLLLEALVWRSLLAMQRIRYSYPKTLLTYLASQYLGLVTPGHAGELLAAGYISMDTGITFGYALSSIVMKKVLFWITIFGFGAWGIPLLAEVTFRYGVQKLLWTGLIGLVVLAAGITLWVFSVRRLTRKWQRLSPWQVDMTEFWAGMRQLTSWRLIVPLALAALSFSLLFLQLDAALRAIGVTLAFPLVSQIMALSRVAARIVTVSVLGIGSKDAAMVLLLSGQGVPWEVGLTAALLLLLCSYVVTLLLSGICWWIKPLVIPRAARSK
ncbi:MAG: hypothetical protein COV75_07055 [Candidatus Omnitrophica bacterium CG11_big_fil_rev_8_21_14_0_20_63_9]|nr:MAG: hypothetical protein COV75_07055 [Candidatus Omnitrophica bacterium CG11_big_fil_rev_8_21_14_0_20_63_9]